MAFELPPLPFLKDALAPHMSAQTLDFDHGKHHQAYVATLNKLIERSPLESRSLEEIESPDRDPRRYEKAPPRRGFPRRARPL